MSGRKAQETEASDLSFGFGMGDRWEAVVRKGTQQGGDGACSWPSGPQRGGGGKVTGGACRGELGAAASLCGQWAVRMVAILSGIAADRSGIWATGRQKELSAPTATMGGVSSVLISQCSSSKAGAIWTQSCPLYKLSAAPRDCSGSQNCWLIRETPCSWPGGQMAPDPLQWLCTTWFPCSGASCRARWAWLQALWYHSDGWCEPPHHTTTSRLLNTFKNTSPGTNGGVDVLIFSWPYIGLHQSNNLRWVTKQNSEKAAATMPAKEYICAAIDFFNRLSSALAQGRPDAVIKIWAGALSCPSNEYEEE